MEELKSCPFCGGEANDSKDLSENDWIFCLDCGVGYQGEDAVRQWNTRPTPDSIKDKLKFNPDWDMLEASQEALREHMKELNRLHDLTVGIEWNGECDVCSGDGYTVEHNHMGCNCGEQQGGPSTCPIQVQCEKCQARGTITRPVTLEEVMEAARVEILSGTIFINKGRLRIKE